VICPLCGQRFDPCTDRFVRLVPMAGRLPGYGWAHRSPGGRGCFYADGGGATGYTLDVKPRILAAEQNDAPDEALAPTG
jgi:hypothetical protein